MSDSKEAEAVDDRETESQLLLSTSSRVYISKCFKMSSEEEGSTPGKEFRHVCDMIGDWGWWQINIVTFTLSSAMFSAFNNLASAFYAPTIPFECDDTISVSFGHDLRHKKKQFTIQVGNYSDDNCYVGNNSCHSWTYNQSTFEYTAIEKVG